MQASEQTSDTQRPPVQVAGLSAPGPPDGPGPRRPVELLPWLPCTLALDIPVVNFTVGSLLALTKGSLVETACHQSTDIPLRVNGLLMAWTEFEVVGERLAARITDMA
jgi:flagellar motor switch/type III secretory pathway protein FliN